jgi:hypothetical protein
MLNATGLIKNWPSSGCYFPTIRGRLMLDFTRRLLLDSKASDSWSNETRMLFKALDMKVPQFLNISEVTPRRIVLDPFHVNLLHAESCETRFHKPLLEGVDPKQPKLYSEFDVGAFVKQMSGAKGFSAESFEEPDSLFFPAEKVRASEKGP